MTRGRRISNNKRRKIKALVTQAYEAYNQHQVQHCLELCQRITALQPDQPDSANLRGLIAFYAGDHASAERCFLAAAKAAPKRADIQLTTAQFYSEQENTPRALHYYEVAYKLNPNEIDAILGYGQLLSMDDQHVQAIEVLKRAKKRMPKHEAVCLALARAYFARGDMAAAQQEVDTILKQQPHHGDALIFQARILIQQAEFDQVEKFCTQILAKDPSRVDAYSMLAEVKTFHDAHDPQLLELQKLYDKTPKNSKEFGILSIALSRILHSLKQYDASFQVVKTFKDTRLSASTYNNQEELAHLQHIIETFDEQAYEIISQSPDDTPIFIVGMPRCGSTLVEQIFASHPDVKSSGEHDYFATSINEVHSHNVERPLTLESMLEQDSPWWERVADNYLKRLRRLHPESRRITDKTLDNIRYIGAIHKALPHAKIIHVERDPMDNCWSIYKNFLVAEPFGYSNSLTDLGYYYLAYQRLMEHWHRTLPEGVIYRLNYETLIQHQQSETEKLLEFCGMPFHPACLKFYEADNAARTVSQSQVRKPIYQDSIQAWRPYEQQLQPLLRILQR